MVEAGRVLSLGLPWGSVIFLQGDLGSGKTTLVRGILLGLGFDGTVTSPTYTLVEQYMVSGGPVYHFDLYRLEHAIELETIGIRDMLSADSLALIEWPQRGQGILPEPDFVIDIEFLDESRILVGPEDLMADIDGGD